MAQPNPSPGSDVARDRRKQILQAAVEVFAERGFHRTRVSDIAKQAGVAYGLIYHYFDSKDHVLNSVFEENWSVFLKVIRDLSEDPELGAAEKLDRISGLLIDALQVAPRIIQVIIQEISRSDRFVHAEKVSAFNEGFDIVHDIIAAGQRAGELRASIEPRVAAYMFFGALETICTGAMLKAIDCETPEQAEAVKRTVREVMLAGMRAGPAAESEKSA